MGRQPFYIVDVFAEQKYSGNQLAVFREANALSTEEMQSIAREMNFSETTFILSDAPTNGGYDVRIFTPGKEIPFAGHPTLGAAYVIQQEIIRQPVERVTLNLQVGQIPVTFGRDEQGLLWMKQAAPQFGATLEPAWLAQVLGLDETDLDSHFPMQEVSTGLPHIIVPLTGLDALKRIRVNLEAYRELIEDTWAKAILAFCREGYNRQELGVRMFADYYGVPEDPATGSGNGCLAAYLVEHRYFQTDSIDVQSGQGFEIGRPSRLHLKAAAQKTAGQDGGIEVLVGGKVIKIAEGEFV